MGNVIVLFTLELFLNTTWIKASTKSKYGKFQFGALWESLRFLLVTSRKTSSKEFNFTDPYNNWFSFYTFVIKTKSANTIREQRISGIKKCLNNQVLEYRPWVCERL